MHGPYLCPRIVDGPDVSAFLHGPQRCSGILRNLCRGILHNLRRGILNVLYGPDLCPRIFLRRPSLELPKQGFIRWWLTIFRLAPGGGFKGGNNFVAGRRVLCGRRRSACMGERAIDIAREDPPAGVSPDAAAAEVRDVLNSIGDTCPECPPD